MNSYADMTADQVLQWDEIRIMAQLKGDTLALGDLFSRELMYIHSSGYEDTYESYLEKIRAGVLKYCSMECSHQRIQITPGAILVNFQMKATALVVGNETNIHSVVSTVWLPEEDAWKLRIFHSTAYDEKLLAKLSQKMNHSP